MAAGDTEMTNELKLPDFETKLSIRLDLDAKLKVTWVQYVFANRCDATCICNGVESKCTVFRFSKSNREKFDIIVKALIDAEASEPLNPFLKVKGVYRGDGNDYSYIVTEFVTSDFDSFMKDQRAKATFYEGVFISELASYVLRELLFCFNNLHQLEKYHGYMNGKMIFLINKKPKILLISGHSRTEDFNWLEKIFKDKDNPLPYSSEPELHYVMNHFMAGIFDPYRSKWHPYLLTLKERIILPELLWQFPNYIMQKDPSYMWTSCVSPGNLKTALPNIAHVIFQGGKGMDRYINIAKSYVRFLRNYIEHARDKDTIKEYCDLCKKRGLEAKRPATIEDALVELIHVFGCDYLFGLYGVSKDYAKARFEVLEQHDTTKFSRMAMEDRKRKQRELD